ncbi:TetR/AcrR family transcriptional regulator [Rhizobium sp. Root708]|uniref:TetR/AcrR family transcriptional regulator n=1 Tax=Rhizobium sp. Root708 TaxID=1736592 RepID=UPI000B215E16|nr:TetR/AcrR family transcriptional regulator C-terminal domain-containing protein [Rhizobium sp. Root708]
MKNRSPGSTRRAEALSKDRIVETAIGILDADGDNGLTFRALSARLETGSGAIYWHVADKQALLDAATDHVMARVMEKGFKGAPREAIKAIALGIFDAIEAHPWIGAHLTRAPWQIAMIRIVEGLGVQVQQLGVPAAAQFDAWSTLINYILGVAGQNAANDRVLPPGTDRSESLSTVIHRWANNSSKPLPFLESIAKQLVEHDDRAQFLAGVDLILRGIDGNQL